jgi:hypothetical protein
VWRRGYRELLAFAGLGSFTAAWEREVLKRKIIGNSYFFNFVFHTTSLRHLSEEI